MSESREFNAESVEEAVERAARETGLSPETLSYEVLDSGSDGFLGIGVRDARILVVLPETDLVRKPEESEPDVAAEYEEPDPVPAETATPPSTDEATEVSSEFMDEVRSLTEEILNASDISTRVDVYDAGDYVAVDLVSDHTALLIGQKGETIDALQHIVNAAAYKNREFQKRIIFDSEGYRQRRIEAIQGMANRMARKAMRESQSVQLPPMSSSERRVVHVFLQDDERVETFSEGSGSDRRVTIAPR